MKILEISSQTPRKFQNFPENQKINHNLTRNPRKPTESRETAGNTRNRPNFSEINKKPAKNTRILWKTSIFIFFKLRTLPKSENSFNFKNLPQSGQFQPILALKMFKISYHLITQKRCSIAKNTKTLLHSTTHLIFYKARGVYINTFLITISRW